MSSVLALKRRLKVLMRTPEYDRDAVWQQEVDSVQAEIESIVGQVTTTAPRQEAARQVRERELEEAQAAKQAAEAQPREAAPTEAPAEAAGLRQRSCDPAVAPARPAPPAPPAQAEETKAMHPALAAMCLWRDMRSRTAYGVAPLLLTAALAAALPPRKAAAALAFAQAALFGKYLHASLEHQGAAYSAAVYAVRDLLPVLAVYVVAAVLAGVSEQCGLLVCD
eukprot:TRINITY_DN21141_c0_g1_i1.p1 TRINITY_DN21141_c0_g1~~TRINITY_DN21141_c0_g1_i1.p1  ORF type:complete len:223 (+),score=66.29 TRINITY_DN21141_c0_g1_i1:70-738(+)